LRPSNEGLAQTRFFLAKIVVRTGSWTVRDAGGSRTHFHRVAAGRLAVWLQRLVVERPRQGSNLVYDLRGVACESGTLRGRTNLSTPPRSRTPSCRFVVCRAVRHTRRACVVEYPDLDSNQGLDVRRVRCYPLHHRDVSSIPTWSRTRTKTLGRSCAFRYTIGTWSRRLDLHQHHPVYKTGASLFGHVGTSTGVRNRTPPGGFGGHLLAQEHTRVGPRPCDRGLWRNDTTLAASRSSTLR
jgi:hypothetical protein